MTVSLPRTIGCQLTPISLAMVNQDRSHAVTLLAFLPAGLARLVSG